MRMRALFLAQVPVALLAGSLAAQPRPAAERLGKTTVAELQRIVDQAAAVSGAVGVQVSVILGDQRADFVSGSANVELDTPMTPETVIQIGSSTKVLNAAMIMTLVEQGMLDLDKPVKTYLPDLTLSDRTAAETITLRQLLSMTSGLDNGPYTRHGGGDDALARYVASLADLPQAFAPGAGWGYSNAGTSIAGHAAERVTGRSWDDLLLQRILEPAGLRHAVSRARDLPFQRVSAGHAPARAGGKPAVIRPWYITQAQGPAGSTLAMSAHDLATFGLLFLSDGKAADGTRVLSHESVVTMTTPVVRVFSRSYTEHWCIGLEREHWSGTPVFGHAGGNMSGTSYLKIFPERRGVLAITVNTPAALGAFAPAIFDGFGPLVFDATRAKLTKPATPIALARPERYLGTYVMLGFRYEVVRDGSGLTMKVTTSSPDGQSSTIQYAMVPLEPDVFLLEGAAGVGSALGDVGFFGRDAEGRATNLVAPVFAARRTD